jgi:hypothetical protein
MLAIQYLNMESPTPKKVTPKLMSFTEAIQSIIDGKRVTRLEWANSDYCFMKGEYLAIYTNGKDHTWMVREVDMLGADWIELPTSN